MPRLVVIVSTIALLGLLASACSAASPGGLRVSEQMQAENPASAPGTSSSVGRSAGTTAGQNSEAEKPAESPMGSELPADRIIIRTADMKLTVKDVADSIDAVTEISQRNGGYVAATNFRYEGERRVASMSLRVPSQTYDDVMRELRKLAIKVDQETSTSQDVTEEFSDLGAQLRNHEVTEAQYLELMKKAQTIDEILKVQQRLADVRGQIERVKGRMQFLQRRSELAQITLSLMPEAAAKAGGGSEWQIVRVAREAWEASLTVLERAAEVVIALIVFFWWLFPLAVIAYFIGRGRWHRTAAPPTP